MKQNLTIVIALATAAVLTVGCQREKPEDTPTGSYDPAEMVPPDTLVADPDPGLLADQASIAKVIDDRKGADAMRGGGGSTTQPAGGTATVDLGAATPVNSADALVGTWTGGPADQDGRATATFTVESASIELSAATGQATAIKDAPFNVNNGLLTIEADTPESFQVKSIDAETITLTTLAPETVFVLKRQQPPAPDGGRKPAPDGGDTPAPDAGEKPAGPPAGAKAVTSLDQLAGTWVMKNARIDLKMVFRDDQVAVSNKPAEGAAEEFGATCSVADGVLTLVDNVDQTKKYKASFAADGSLELQEIGGDAGFVLKRADKTAPPPPGGGDLLPEKPPGGDLLPEGGDKVPEKKPDDGGIQLPT